MNPASPFEISGRDGAGRIATDDAKCVGCNRCIRVCPVETANIAYQDMDGNTKVSLDPSQCILCGACIGVCEHDARHIGDDTDRFFEDLRRGVPIAVMTAPSIRTAMPEWKRLFSWLRTLGVDCIYDVSLGADICIWAHLRYIEQNPAPIVTQPCPVVVSFCEHHRHDLLPFLSPVHSPMACTAIYMRRAGVTGAIASLSPCVAKAMEHESTGLVQYNVTFQRLTEYMEREGVRLPAEESAFDHPDAGPGTLFPLPGGLRENLEFFAGKALHVEKAEGASVFRYLDQFAATAPENRPDVFDVLSCADGCLLGPATVEGQDLFAVNKRMQAARDRAAASMEQSRARLAEYDRQLQPGDFMRRYTAIPGKHPAVGEEEIRRAFLQMQKDDYSKQHFNCGACGSESCYHMARKVTLGVNIPMNCVILSRDEAKYERKRNAEYLALVQNIGDNLFSTQDDAYAGQVLNSLRLLSESIRCSAVAIWSKTGGGNDLTFERVSGWYGDDPSRITINGEWPEEWTCRLRDGQRIVAAGQDKPGLFPEAVTSLFIVPIHIRGEFWGFVDAVSIEARVFRDEEASLLEAAGILLISGLRERALNRRLVDARETALAASQAKGDFLSNMSHEIRTPLNAIVGMTSIGESAADAGRKDYAFGKIKDASTHLLGVINDILDMSKIEANKLELSPVDFHFEKLLQKVVNIINFRVEEKQQELHASIDPDIPPFLIGDDQRLAQVVTNLLSNAVKFTPEGGTIRLDTRYLGMKDGLCGVGVTVTDTGIGLSEEQQARLFTSFSQADSGTSRKFGGTGLGLAISKRIVELMGGRIGVRSEPEKGSAFAFEVWLERSARPAAPLLDAAVNWQTIRLLAVDDDGETRDYFADLTKRLGLCCHVAAGGEEALALIRENGPYDLYFIDWRMPGMNGIELAQHIREQYGGRPMVAMISAVDWSEIEAAAREAGISRYLQKPLFPSSIADLVNECLASFERPAAPESLPDGSEYLAGRRMLLVEDVEINREIVSTLLEPTGIVIESAVNGIEALEKIRSAREPFDIVFMDIQMPEMDGYEATIRIRSLNIPWAKTVPIIAMTANVFKEDVERCLACGMDSHIGKPLNIDDMMQMMYMYLSR